MIRLGVYGILIAATVRIILYNELNQRVSLEGPKNSLLNTEIEPLEINHLSFLL